MIQHSLLYICIVSISFTFKTRCEHLLGLAPLLQSLVNRLLQYNLQHIERILDIAISLNAVDVILHQANLVFAVPAIVLISGTF